jgi:hypothetical protein
MKKFTLALIALATPLFSDGDYDAWMTGPLLCPAYACLPKGSYNIEPYLYTNIVYGSYNRNWHERSQAQFLQVYNSTLIQVGITNNFNVSISPQFNYQSLNNHSSANIADLPLQLYFTILNENSKLPGLILGIKATAPIGKFKNLNPDTALVDAMGGGSWKPAVDITFGKKIHLYGVHFLTLRSNFTTQFRTKIPVSGFHAYGGGYHTRGTVTLGTQYTLIASFEYSFSRHGVLAFDALWQHNNKITYQGRAGFIDPAQTLRATNSAPSSEQLSIAPAVEYNFNDNVGLIAGVWFSIAGRNQQAFVSPTCALNIEY